MSKRSASILMVDDEQEIVRALQRSINAHGYTVRTAHSSEEALEAVAKWRHDLLMLDLLLPEMSGLEVCCPPDTSDLECAHHRALAQRCRRRQGQSARPGGG